MKRGETVFVVAAGRLGDGAFFREMVRATSPVAVICADGGARRLRTVGVLPDLLVGDMDSVDGETLRACEAAGCRTVRHPCKKDETDTELALMEAFALAPGEVWVWGAMGGRIDHALANVSLLALDLKRDVAMRLVDDWCDVFLVDGKREIAGKTGQTVSLLPFMGDAAGVTLDGFEYPLQNGRMGMGHPFGVSNRLIRDVGTIDIASGVLLVVRFFRPGAFPEEEAE